VLRFGAGLLGSGLTAEDAEERRRIFGGGSTTEETELGTEFHGVPETRLDLSRLSDIVSFEPADQVVVVRAGTSISDLNVELAKEGQCLPIGPVDIGSEFVGTAMGLNFPHTLESQCGTWRDWVLGLTIVQADGTVAKAGSKAVKNVAGYDVQKLFIGARDSLGVVAEVILRTYPLKALPTPDVIRDAPNPFLDKQTVVVQRVLRTDFNKAAQASTVILADRATCTLWHIGEPIRFESDWAMRMDGPPDFLDIVQLRFMQRAKSLFDPAHKLNPGVLGELIG